MRLSRMGEIYVKYIMFSKTDVEDWPDDRRD
jgi:hypothetical protein